MKKNCFTELKKEELKKYLYENPIIIYTDYRDQMETRNLKELQSRIEDNPNEDPLVLFQEYLNEIYEDYGYDNCLEDYDYKNFAETIGLDYDSLSEEEKEELQDTANEYCWYEPDYNHYLDQTVCINIIIDSGDYNFDLGCNQVYPHYDGDYEDLKQNGIQKESCIRWLAEKQGYDEPTTRLALADKKFSNSKFLESLQEELLNCSSHMNCLVFLKEMTIKEWLEALKASEITIPKRTSCGLIDFWSGAGGLINIQLEKEITVKKEEIHEIIPDECKRYSIHEIFDCTDARWN